jgi:putative flavoprotein involved in K+ transport
MGTEHFETVIIGGGQAGLTMGYRLTKAGRPFVILDAHARTGDAWRTRWDSLRLFTPRLFSGLPGMRLPGSRHSKPTKDEMADYLESYASRFALPIRHGVRVQSLTREDGTYVVRTGEQTYSADYVVVATGAHAKPHTPAFARELDPQIVQLHSCDYVNAGQLREGGVLLVGAGNSGADIALDVVRTHPTWLAGRHPGHVPFRIDSLKARVLLRLVRFVGHRVLTLGTPVGRKVIPKMRVGGNPLIRIKPKDLLAAGVTRVTDRVVGVRDGRPVLADGTALDVANVIWCTGSHPDMGWIDLSILDHDGALQHSRGVVDGEPGLYFLGQEFQWSATSATITGLGRDSAHLLKAMTSRKAVSRPALATAA